ncbi:Ribonuclease HI [Diplonema papillatum]|nr:Ribonuclease HI [Diplonema papillatum]
MPAIAQRHGTVDAERLRQMVVDEMGARPADYRPYMVMEPGPDSRGLTVAEELAKWQAYLAAMRRNATYGDELTLRAASRVLRCDIWVLNATSREALRGCRQPSPTATIVLTYRPEHYDTVILPLPSQRLLEATTGDTVPLARLALINAGPVAGTDAPTHHLPTGVPAAARTRQRNTRPRAPEPRLPSIAEAKQDRSWSPHDDDIVIVTINVTSLDTEKLLVVALLKADIVVLQETRVTKAEKAYMGSFLAAYGWNVHWGDDVTMVEGGDGRSQRRPGGVAVLTRQHLTAQLVAAVEDSEKRVVASTRVVHVVVALGDGRTALHIFSLYGQSGNSVQVQGEREQLITEVLGIAAGLGQVPTLVVGDFNCSTETSSVLAAACRSGRWADAAAAYAVGQGEEPPCTCWAPNATGGSRIDLCLANACAAPAISKVCTVERKNSEFHTHAPMYVTMRQQVFRERHRRAILPTAFPRAYPLLNLSEKSLLEVFANEAKEAMTGAMSLKQLSQHAESYLLMLHRRELALPSRAYKGRGNQVVSDSRLATKFQHSSTRGASTKQTRARDELLGHLRTLVQAARERLRSDIPYPLTRREEKAREAARKRVGRGHIPEAVANIVMSGDLSELQALQSALTSLEGSQRAAFSALRRHRKAQWTHKMQEAWAHGRGLVFNFIADKYASPLTFLRRDDGTLTANAAEIDEILRGEKAWGGIFQRYTTREEPCWGRFLRMYSPVLPDRAEMECEAITVGDVKAALAKMKKSASAGMHGWRIHELQQLPNSLLEGFARVLNEVEESGEWPEELMHALVSLIPKPKSTGDPLSQRPISVAPVLYRIWAAVRAKDAQRWMDELAPEGLHGCRPKHSTEDLFWHLAAEIEEAHLMGRPLYGIAFDFKKCFDSVPINVTLQLAKKLGFNRKQWKHGGELWNAMHWWLNRLRWAHVGSEHAVTFLELAIDFEVTTGVRLPIVANRRIQPPAASKAKATSARAVLPPRETTEGLCMYFDGGSRQNGTALAVAGAGAVIYKDGLKLAETTVPLGRTTNNVAEYNGLIAGIRLLGEQPGDVEGPVKVRGDSQVVIGPVNGTAMCKPNLRPYFLQARASMADLTPRFEFSLEHVPRSRNVDADALSNAAMDRVQAETGAQAVAMPTACFSDIVDKHVAEPSLRTRLTSVRDNLISQADSEVLRHNISVDG